ncbi:MAG: DUF2383 domain-containing protein [Agriterribacter sp.]
MLKPSSYKAPSYVTQKLFRLLGTLKSERDRYAETASKITDRQLRDNINMLAQENNQYANELLSQLQIMGSDNDNSTSANESVKILVATSGAADESGHNTGSILQFCKDGEKKMIRLYREILNEPYLGEDIRRLMRCQLNGIMYAFLRLKQYSSTI